MVQDLWMPKVNEMERDDSFGRLLDITKGQAGDNRRYVRDCAKYWLREVAQLLYEMCIKPVEWIERHVSPVKVRKLKTVTGNWDPFADRRDIRLQDGVNFTSGTSDPRPSESRGCHQTPWKWSTSHPLRLQSPISQPIEKGSLKASGQGTCTSEKKEQVRKPKAKKRYNKRPWGDSSAKRQKIDWSAYREQGRGTTSRVVVPRKTGNLVMHVRENPAIPFTVTSGETTFPGSSRMECWVPGCFAGGEMVKDHAFRKHIPGVFSESLDSSQRDVLAGREQALLMAATFLRARPSTLEELRADLDVLCMLGSADNRLITDDQQQAMAAFAQHLSGSNVLDTTFRLHLFSEVAAMIHW
ncbi:hypothetical protein ACOMHN_011243 [Nucella lapillus]